MRSVPVATVTVAGVAQLRPEREASFTTDAAKKYLASDRFQNRWNEINRRVHGAVVVVLTGGQKGRISTSGGKVTLDLSSVTSDVQTRLQDSGSRPCRSYARAPRWCSRWA